MVSLVAAVIGDVVRKHREERVQHCGLLECHLLDVGEVLGGPALDDVRRQGEGRTDKPENCGCVAHLLAQDLERLADVGGRGVGVKLAYLPNL